MKPHKHAELIKAWADGAVIQRKIIRTGENIDEPIISYSWLTENMPMWSIHEEYRIKPEPKPDVEKFFILEANPILGLRLNEIAGFKKQPHEDWIRVVFDGETAKMKSAEVLK